MLNNVFIFIVALYMVVKGAAMATKYSAKLAEGFRLSKYTIGFFVVALISILPETFISVDAAMKGMPEFGLGVLLGSNIADLTLIFAILVFYAGRSLKVESKILKNHVIYPFLLLLPLILGFDGHFSRLEGAALIVAGVVFYYITLRNGERGKPATDDNSGRYKNVLMLLVSMAVLLLGAHFTVTSAVTVASALGVSSLLIGMLVVGLGTTMPELFFSLESIKKRSDSLAIGDLLGTVLADATVVLGILALVNPFTFSHKLIYITGGFMVIAAFILFKFMRSGRALTRREAFLLLAFWLVFVVVEFLANT